MPEGKSAIIMAVVELVLYIALCLYRYNNLNIGPAYFERESVLYKMLFDFILVSAALGIFLRTIKENKKAAEQHRSPHKKAMRKTLINNKYMKTKRQLLRSSKIRKHNKEKKPALGQVRGEFPQ